jgi:CBS domain-containing protein
VSGIQTVRDIMVRNVVTASPSMNLTDIAKLMRKKRVGSVVITKGRTIAGILTESDLVKLVARGRDMKNAVAEDDMVRNVVTCDPSVTVIDALMIMRAEKIRHLPVVKHRNLVGVISIRDLIAATQFSSYYII